MLGAAAANIQGLQSSEYLVDKGIEAAFKTDLGQRLRTVGASAATGASIGFSIGTAFPVIGNAVGAIVGSIAGTIAGAIPWIVSVFNPCEFMVRGEGGVRCEDFPGRVERATKWVQANPVAAVSMTPAQLASKFGIFLNQAEAEYGMGPDAGDLKKLPEAQELLRLVQVPAASAYMTTVPAATYQQTLQAMGQMLPALKVADIRTIQAKVAPASNVRSIIAPAPSAATKIQSGQQQQWSTGKKVAVGAGVVAASFFGYAYYTKQSPKAVAGKIKRSFRG